MTKDAKGEKRKSQSQLDKFKEAARELETDDSEEAFDAALKRVGKAKPPNKSGAETLKSDKEP